MQQTIPATSVRVTERTRELHERLARQGETQRVLASDVQVTERAARAHVLRALEGSPVTVASAIVDAIRQPDGEQPASVAVEPLAEEASNEPRDPPASD